MTRAWRKGNRRYCWPLLAIVLALSFLGHDAAVVANLHRIDAPRAIAASQHQLGVDLDLRGATPTPERLCEPDQGASLTSSSARSHAWTMQGTTNPSTGLATEVVPITTPDVPPLCSGVRLALLQVFLI